MLSRLQLFTALSVAAIARLWREAGALRASMVVRTAYPPETIIERLAYCRACPVYFPLLGTCGSPLRRFWVRVRQWFTGLEPGESYRSEMGGCDCHMATKARLQANCWAYDMGYTDIPNIWPARLNSFPPDPSKALQ